MEKDDHAMPALLLSDETLAVLQRLVAREGGREDAGVLVDLKTQLQEPPRPKEEGARYPAGTVIDHKCLLQVVHWAQTHKSDSREDDLRLSVLLRGAKVAIPAKAKPTRSPQLIETLRRIQLAQDEAEYDKMVPRTTKTGGVAFGFRTSKEKQSPWQTKEQRTDAEEWDEVRRQIGAIFNVGLSVVAVAAATWWAGGDADPIWKTLTALPLSLLVAVAEIALYLRHWDNVQKRKEAAGGRRG